MELQLQNKDSLLSPIQSTKFKSKSKTAAATAASGGGGNKFVGVRQRPSGRWVSEIKDTTQKIRMWLGTFETAEEAARAYDEAACLLRGTNTRTNFSTRRPAAAAAAAAESPLAARIRKLLHHKKLAGTAAAAGGIGSPSSSASNTADSGGRKQESPATSENYQEVYRPYFAADFHLSTSVPESTPSSSWAFEAMFDGFELSKSADFEVMSAAGCGVADCATAGVSEFERMKVERQISASLYAMNGVQEYFEAVQDLSSSSLGSALVDPVWDLPPLYHFY